MSDDEPARLSPSGWPIQHHKHRERELEPAIRSDDAEFVERHIASHLGPIEGVWHELISDLVHIDVLHIKATPERPFHWFVTTGMSDRAMKPPADAASCRFAELMIALPQDWPLGDEAFAEERNYWPVRLLKTLARIPHEHETWLWWSHTVTNGDPPRPFVPSVGFTGSLLAPPVHVSLEFRTCQVNPEKAVSFFSVLPIYPEEMTLKLEKGADALFDRFDACGVTELLDTRRRNVARAWWQFWRS